MQKYSLWIPVTGSCGDEIKSVISKLSLENNSPEFSPHLTVSVDMEGTQQDVERIVQNIAKNHQPVNLNLSEISFSSTYFQSVLVRVQSCEWLMNLFIRVRNDFQLPVSKYMPHISLLYGLDSMRQRETIARETKLKCSSFLADRFELIAYDPSNTDVSSWKNVGTFPFNR